MNEATKANIPYIPEFCQYSSDVCDQDLSELIPSGNFFIYPSEPAPIRSTVKLAIENLRTNYGSHKWISWEDLRVSGQIIFCEICKAVLTADIVIADISTLSFNVLFEIGFAVGMERPVLLIRDTSYAGDRHLFNELGILDTIGYVDYSNSKELASKVYTNLKRKPLFLSGQDINRAHPIYLIKSHIDTDGSIRIASSIKKSGLRFRNFDPKEDVRLTMRDAWKQVTSSLGIVAHLLSKERSGSLVNNARCSFVGGMAVAAGKKVLMLHEGVDSYPIDYRDIIKEYTNIEAIPKRLEPFFIGTIQKLQDLVASVQKVSSTQLSSIDLGDIAAENESTQLKEYFINTGSFTLAKQGHRRIVIGRKGSGKTAIFYRLRDMYEGKIPNLVVDLKPEGHQFVKLRETVLSNLSPGLQEHVMAALWHYIFLLEIAHKIVTTEETIASRDNRARESFQKVIKIYEGQYGSEQGDFSERLLKLVDDITARYQASSEIIKSSQVTELVYKEDIRDLQDALEHYLLIKKEIWILVDNIDKGWPVHGATNEDIMIIRTLLSATRKMQREFEKRNIQLKSIVFLRNDIYEHLIQMTPDREKDTVITLDWDDIELFKEMIVARIRQSLKIEGSFEDVWRAFFSPLIEGVDSFAFIVERTLMRPRDVLKFVLFALEVAINRKHAKVSEDDITQAEGLYSEDMLQNFIYEIKDIFHDFPDVIYEFLGCSVKLSKSDIESFISKSAIAEGYLDKILKMLLWFGFIGVVVKDGDAKYAYEVNYDLERLKIQDDSTFVVHPAFRKSLECTY
ncbi:MAG: hypothetical protein WA126_06690 [Thermodesulfovibrionales bacterium]